MSIFKTNSRGKTIDFGIRKSWIQNLWSWVTLSNLIKPSISIMLFEDGEKCKQVWSGRYKLIDVQSFFLSFLQLSPVSSPSGDWGHTGEMGIGGGYA